MQPLKETIENYIRNNIPITRNIDVHIKHISREGAVFSAPLAPNINDKSIGFAGSIETLLTISSWGWLFSLFQDIDPEVQLYIRRCSFEFNKPVRNDLQAFVEAPDNTIVGNFLADYSTSGKARIKINAFIGEKSEPDSEFSGTFTAVSSRAGLLLLNR